MFPARAMVLSLRLAACLARLKLPRELCRSTWVGEPWTGSWQLLSLASLESVADRKAKTLDMADKRRLELARALADETVNGSAVRRAASAVVTPSTASSPDAAVSDVRGRDSNQAGPSVQRSGPPVGPVELWRPAWNGADISKRLSWCPTGTVGIRRFPCWGVAR
jgi:hypothetical protein